MVAAFNNYAQAYINAMNALNLPVYTNLPSVAELLTLTEDGTYNTVLNDSAPYNEGFTTFVGTNLVVGLLEWVLTNLYGIPRPTLGTLLSSVSVGDAYNSFAYNKRTYNDHSLTKTYSYSPADDDIYKRVATWNLYKGDGYQFTGRWLKRRVARFLTGTGGVDPGIDQTYGVGVQYLPNYKIQINCSSVAPGAAFIQALADLIASGACSLPFQYVFSVVTV